LRCLAHLGRATRDAVDRARRDGLHGVGDEQVGLDLVDLADDDAEVDLARQVQVVVHRPGAFGTEPDLVDGFFCADVEDALARGCGSGGDLEQQGRLADAGLAAQQDRGTRHHAAAEDAVELADAGLPALHGGAAGFGDRSRGAGTGDGDR
jgi:hypothetical protein